MPLLFRSFTDEGLIPMPLLFLCITTACKIAMPHGLFNNETLEINSPMAIEKITILDRKMKES